MAFRYDPIDQELEALTRLAGGLAGKRVLEVGCGNGRITRKYASQAAHVDAIDPNESKIERAFELALADETHVHYHAVALEDFVVERPYDLVILAWSL
ncbi:MAG: methyltransferase domain-containing protein [Chloroflexi bacterium]|nr:methyltransferase domain-containing protein [Chloroflexota bacterium]